MSAFSERWTWRSMPRNLPLPDLIDRLNEQCRRLDQTLYRWADDLEHGPIPGAYLQVHMTASASVALTTGVKDLVPISYYAVPKAIFAWIPGGGANQVTFQVNNGGGNPILASNAVITSSLTLNEPGDFIVNPISSPDLNLEIISVDAGTPQHIAVAVMLQNVTLVEPQ